MNTLLSKNIKSFPSSDSNLNELYDFKYYILWNIQKLSDSDPGNSFQMTKKINQKLNTQKDFLYKEIEERHKEREKNQQFNDFNKKNLALEVKKMVMIKKMKFMKTKMFQKFSAFKISQEISNLEFEKNKLSKNLANYINTHRVKFGSCPNKYKLTKLIHKLKKILNKKNKKLLDDFYNISFFKEIIGKEKETTTKKKIGVTKEKAVLINEENKNISELYQAFYEINQDSGYFMEFYKNFLKNNYDSKNMYFEDLPFYMPNMGVLETFKNLDKGKKPQKEKEKLNQVLDTNLFCLDAKDGKAADFKKEEQQTSTQMELEEIDDYGKKDFAEFFEENVYDPVVFKNKNDIQFNDVRNKLYEFLLNVKDSENL